jgi:hypothetical protein
MNKKRFSVEQIVAVLKIYRSRLLSGGSLNEVSTG